MIVITEAEKSHILSKYRENIDKNLLTFLKRHYPPNGTLGGVNIGNRILPIESNKKYLVWKLAGDVQQSFPKLSEAVIRRTIKYYLDTITFLL